MNREGIQSTAAAISRRPEQRTLESDGYTAAKTTFVQGVLRLVRVNKRSRKGFQTLSGSVSVMTFLKPRFARTTVFGLPAKTATGKREKPPVCLADGKSDSSSLSQKTNINSQYSRNKRIILSVINCVVGDFQAMP